MRLSHALAASLLACPAALAPTVSAQAGDSEALQAALPVAPAATASDDASMRGMAGMDMSAGHRHGAGQLGPYPATRDASGTAWQPDSAQHDGLHLPLGAWTLMLHGEATLVYDDQGGRRGHTETVVLSHLVVDAQHPLAGGVLTLKGLFSLDPLIGQEGYPLLLQTGETGDGRTRLIDRQHPHDLIGELAAAYSHPLAAGVSGFVYGGPAGEPALGPPVYLHRAAGLVDPETPIDHHWLDSTHLVFGVVTGGLVAGGWKLEASSFRGREPDEHRYDIEEPGLDSWSVRLSWNPSPDLALEVSRGHLHSVEQLQPEDDQDRTIASAVYNRAFTGGNWQTVFAWGPHGSVRAHGRTRRDERRLPAGVGAHSWGGHGVRPRRARHQGRVLPHRHARRRHALHRHQGEPRLPADLPAAAPSGDRRGRAGQPLRHPSRARRRLRVGPDQHHAVHPHTVQELTRGGASAGARPQAAARLRASRHPQRVGTPWCSGAFWPVLIGSLRPRLSSPASVPSACRW